MHQRSLSHDDSNKNTPMRATVASTGRTVRPRRMYFAVFVWLALPGRFLSLFLLSKGLSNTQIGIMVSVHLVPVRWSLVIWCVCVGWPQLSLSPLVSALLGPHIAALTDAAESRRDTSALPFLHVRGLEAGMCVCVALTAVVFCAYALFEPREGGVDTLSWEFGAMACIQVNALRVVVRPCARVRVRLDACVACCCDAEGRFSTALHGFRSSALPTHSH